MIKLDFQSRTPIYLQLERNICELILLGQLEEDEALPSVRSLARDLGINPNTIQKSYQDLEAAGVIYSAPGKGSYAADPAQARKLLHSSCLEKLESALKEARIAGLTQSDINGIIEKVYTKKG